MKLNLSLACISLLVASASASANMTAVKIFDVDSCKGAPLQVVFTPTEVCNSISRDAECSLEAKDLGIFASGSCTDDPRAFAAGTFGDFSYVMVELYSPDMNCSNLEGVAAYRVDNKCHPTIDTTTSFRAAWNGATPSFKLFADSLCTSSPLFQFDLDIDSSECVGGSMKLFAVASTN
ncbi:uncharacterized protein PITG_06721 [Phytophthora infestans T30-4]|uniref:Secreted protein n=1 Tax=Phytophthora infestans (strain T30-4) TaxID=403677 RepID=D0N7Y1_PHYIT|nr:uncharacterized protein PITG_06721 [Phytophthora infestans T30-4]EEY53098.1 conserved hypothetical protein [Phytophthora infestans T30-4]|eukprot:XP_002904716.1 conserved hypothetical protein [Phytophthora infestans T30-4]